MEGGGPDGGSDEMSYESVASEGGYEPASERGRDPLPRIISSSHCVEVFRQICWTNGAYCCRDTSPDDVLVKAPTAMLARARGLEPHDPLAELPDRIMRFDGAMEAWLEEMPLPRNPNAVPRLYTSLNDAACRLGGDDLPNLRTGNRRAVIWYFTLEFLQQLWPLFLSPDGSGIKLWERALLDRACNIQSTHTEVGRVHCSSKGKNREAWLKALFSDMQGCKWCPDGEAQKLLVSKRLTHASMSIGDAVQIGSELYIVGLTGFMPVQEAVHLLPAGFEVDVQDETGSEEEVEEELPSPPAEPKPKAKQKNKKAKGGAKGEKEEAVKEEVKEEPKVTEQTGKNGTDKGRSSKGGKGGKKGRKKGGKKEEEADGGGEVEDVKEEPPKGGKIRSSKGGAQKGAGKGKGRGKGKGKGKESAEPADNAKSDGNDRADRRALRARLQAERELMQSR